MGEPDCIVCQIVEGATAEEIFIETDEWLAQTMLDAPGWAMVSLKRHAEGVWGMTAEEASALGPILGALAKGIHEKADGEKVHLFAMGERVPHLHLILAPRKPGETPIFHGPDLDAKARELADRPQALLLLDAVRKSIATAPVLAGRG
jgi:diadenosine tetraphosphate (Ap4A) HIT family hydrolase